MGLKIALCLSGALRNFEDTYDFFYEHLLKKHSPDVFFYGVENKNGKIENESKLKQLYKPKKYCINESSFYTKIDCAPHNTYYSLYNVYQANLLKCLYAKESNVDYDIVLRCRTDYFWFRDLTNQEIELAGSAVLTPIEWSFKQVYPLARSDCFAIGSSELMDDYSNLYNKRHKYEGILHPETLCGIHLHTEGINNIEIKRHVIFEYPCKKSEKYIRPHIFHKYLSVDGSIKEISNIRKFF